MVHFRNVYTNPHTSEPGRKPDNNINYWLEKLFDQENSIKQENTAANKITVRKVTDSRRGDIEMDRRLISDMVHSSNDILMSISSVYPFDFFPTTLNVEATRVTIITRQLFASQVHSVDIKDISSIFIETGILFAAITIISKTFSQKQLLVNRLWKKEAILLRRIIEGLRMFEKKQINTTNFSREELLGKLEELSATKIVL